MLFVKDCGLVQRKTFQRFFLLTGRTWLLQGTSALRSEFLERTRRLPRSSRQAGCTHGSFQDMFRASLPDAGRFCPSPSTDPSSPSAQAARQPHPALSPTTGQAARNHRSLRTPLPALNARPEGSASARRRPPDGPPCSPAEPTAKTSRLRAPRRGKPARPSCRRHEPGHYPEPEGAARWSRAPRASRAKHRSGGA